MKQQMQDIQSTNRQSELSKTKLNEAKDKNEQTMHKQLDQLKPNPTYKSQIFNDSQNENKDPSYSDIFGIAEKVKEIKTTTAGLVSKANSIQQSVAHCLNSKQIQVTQQEPSTDGNKKKDRGLPFNAMWWDTSAVPNNDQSALTQDYAKQRKLKDYLVDNVFDNQPTEAVKKAVQDCNDKNSSSILNQVENSSTKGQKDKISSSFNIISHSIEKKGCQNGNNQKKLATKENLEDRQLAEQEEQARKVNRNYSNLFGRAYSANSRKDSNNSFIDNKSELFLPANANIDKFDSKRYNPRTDKENNDVNAAQRRFKNLQSVLDQHDYKSVLSNNTNKLGNKTSETTSVLDNLSQFLSQKPPIPKKSYMRIADTEKMILLEIKSLSAHFDKEAFKKFCLLKGYRVIVFQAGQNGRGEVFLKEARKNPDLIDSVSSHLKIHGAAIAANRIISSQEFNGRNFEAAPKIKNEQLVRPSTGKKHFASNQQSSTLVHNVIF